ncbi:sigma-70 family RNA polymerase sigma factor [Evansella sp. AB-P1]|nr:sigma-70 family RNA polymerase sigma factor [Evansella sp. AB-P1]MDG5787704.1 sigma-70 family RNA polymerase sigma factor [Evansella sp. AB-P1]
MSHDRKKEEISDWYFTHSDAILKFILLIVRDYQQAEDLTQETFVKAYKHYESFKGTSTPKTWLFSVAHNVTVDYLRRNKPIVLFKDFFGSYSVDKNPLPEDIVEIKEESKELYDAISNLKYSYRKIIILRKMKEFSTREAGEILNWSESKVKSTLSRAMVALEKELNKGGNSNEAISKTAKRS